MSMDSFSDHLVSGYQPLSLSDGGEQSVCISDDELEETNPKVFQERQSDLMMALRERVQNPHLGSFCMEDLVWTDHVTKNKGKSKSSKLAIIFWDRLDDFIKGEQSHPDFPCKYTKETVRKNLPNSLRSPRAHSPALLLRYLQFYMFFVYISYEQLSFSLYVTLQNPYCQYPSQT